MNGGEVAVKVVVHRNALNDRIQGVCEGNEVAGHIPLYVRYARARAGGGGVTSGRFPSFPPEELCLKGVARFFLQKDACLFGAGSDGGWRQPPVADWFPTGVPFPFQPLGQV